MLSRFCSLMGFTNDWIGCCTCSQFAVHSQVNIETAKFLKCSIITIFIVILLMFWDGLNLLHPAIFEKAWNKRSGSIIEYILQRITPHLGSVHIEFEGIVQVLYKDSFSYKSELLCKYSLLRWLYCWLDTLPFSVGMISS